MSIAGSATPKSAADNVRPHSLELLTFIITAPLYVMQTRSQPGFATPGFCDFGSAEFLILLL
jgi:hypothetical protein